MARSRILVVGANGNLGRAIIALLGPDRAIAATRSTATAPDGFDHMCLAADGTPLADGLADCDAVINAAGRVSGDRAALMLANVDLPQKIAVAAREAGVRKMIQVSSFSAYGPVEHIDAATPVGPTSDYGRCKLQGDEAIAALATADFAVESLRLPFMFSRHNPGLLAPLLTLAQTVRMLPVVRGKAICRSMLTYADAAGALVDCAADNLTGATMAADPLLFDYPLLAKLIEGEIGNRVRLFPISMRLATIVEAVAPAIGRRLFRSSVLDPSVNRMGKKAAGLDAELRAYIRDRYRV